MIKRIWSIINSQFFMLIIGFILTGIVGHYLTIKYQDASWQRDRKYEVFKQEIEEAKKVLEDVTLHISTRTYDLQKVHWKLENGDFDQAKKQYLEYSEVKDSWNKKIRIYRNKIKRLVDEGLAFRLLDSDNATSLDKKASVHSYFVIAHDKTRRWIDCLQKKCKSIHVKQMDAHNALKELFQVTDKFIDQSYEVFLRKYKSLSSDI